MIVLDEQLLGYGLQATIGKWYRGSVIDITQLRPRSRIPDDAIPELLRRVKVPSFVTINVSDFWRSVAPDTHFAILCFDLQHFQARDISSLLRRLFATPPFRTRRSRLGTIARISWQEILYYSTESWAIQRIAWRLKK